MRQSAITMRTTASARFPVLQLLTENKKLKQSLLVLLCCCHIQLPRQELICRQLAPANQPFFLTCVARGFVFHWIRSEPRGVSFVSLALTLKHLRTMLVTPAPEGPVLMDASKHKQSIMGFEVSMIHALHIGVTTGQLLQSLCRFFGDYFHNCRILSCTSSYSVKE